MPFIADILAAVGSGGCTSDFWGRGDCLCARHLISLNPRVPAGNSSLQSLLDRPSEGSVPLRFGFGGFRVLGFRTSPDAKKGLSLGVQGMPWMRHPSDSRMSCSVLVLGCFRHRVRQASFDPCFFVCCLCCTRTNRGKI